MSDRSDQLETDPRFPSGPWTGFWLQAILPGRQFMELQLKFCTGALSGEGRDRVGPFTFRGHYDTQDGKCTWIKQYIGQHSINYKGYNEGKGIWGVWEMAPENAPAAHHGGFHIWPKGMHDPTQPTLGEETEAPLEAVVEELAVTSR
jgi:hypothetical protein